MSGTTPTGEETPLSPYEVGPYRVYDDELTVTELGRLREEYGYVRTYFRVRAERYRTLQLWLNQARNGQMFDEYLQRSVYYSVAVALGGVLLGALLTGIAAALGIGVVSDPLINIPVSEGLGAWYRTNQLLFVAAQVAVFIAVVTGGATWLVRYYYPRLVVDNRRQSIAFMLPNAIIMMYALSRGGMSLPVIIERIADAGDAYGEVANEFDVIARDMNLFGTDLYTAIRNARNLTPSDPLEQFLDDLVNVVESGGNVTGFFQEQSKAYLREAQDEQEQFLETLGVLSEVFIVGFVAAPLFLVVILLVISVLGGNQLLQLILIVYAVIPLSMAGYLVLLSTLSEPYVFPESTLEIDEDVAENSPETVDAADDAKLAAYRAHKRRERLRRSLRNPLAAIRYRPVLSLVVTVPTALVLAAACVLTGFVSPSFAALTAEPVRTTSLLFVFPFLVVAIPLSFFHELKRGYEDEIAKRFPDTLNILSSANNMGVPLANALSIVARWSGGRFAEELRVLRNDVAWSNDLRRSLLRFANRMRVPQVSQTVKLIAEAVGSTRDLSQVLSVAAEDTRNRYRLLRKRRSAMGSYVGVVIIGYLVYLLVIVMLDVSFLTPIAELSAQADAGPGAPDAPVSFQGVPVATYRMIFFHSVLIQGVGSGLLTGQLASNDVYNGLKYSVLLVLLALLAFLFV